MRNIVKKWRKSRLIDEKELVGAEELNELDEEEKEEELIEDENEWEEDLKEENERGYNDYNWHEGEYDN